MKGTSHRARIPSTLNWQFKITPTLSSYTLNVSSGKMITEIYVPIVNDFHTGTFTEILENDEIRIERRLFASQEYTELLLAHVKLIRLAPKGLTCDLLSNHLT